MTAALQQAVDVFKELGWAGASPEQAMTLPLGTAEQRGLAAAGLRSGEWGEWARTEQNTWQWVSSVDVDDAMLALFAIRVGVDAGRAVAVLARHRKGVSQDVLVAVLADRGPAFAAGFVQHACVRRRRPFENAASVFAGVAVRLVARLNLPVPENVEYMKDWAVYAAKALGQPAEAWHDEPDVAQKVIQARFAEHVRVGVAVGAPATGPFGTVIPAGVAAGWLERDEAVGLVFAALDAAVRPGDRQVWVGALDKLGVTDAELLARADALVPLLATGEAAVINRLAPLLIEHATDATATEAVAAALTTRTAKTLRTVLESGLARPGLAGADDLASQLGALAAGKDRQVARLASRLIEHWAVEAPSARPVEPEVRGLWQPTPPLWAVPRFDHGPETPEALTELAADLIRRPDGAVDVAV